MKVNRMLTWFGLMTLFVFVGAGVLPGSAWAQTGTTLAINPTPAEARTCSTTEVAVRVADVANLTAFHLELAFDPAKIEVTAVQPGSWLIGVGESYLPEITNAVNNIAGTVVWGLAKQGSGGNPNPVSSSGDILVLTIKAKLPNETSALTIDGAKSMLVDWPEAQSIPFTDTDGVINTRSCAPTDIALSNATIAENQPGNTVIGTLSATDPDTGDTSFTYTFADLVGHPDAQYFNISGSSLRANIPFDYETKSSYSIRIKVTDSWGESYEEDFLISVTDVNDAPVLAFIGNKTVNELEALSFSASASDADLPAQTLAYSLAAGTSGAVPAGPAIDPATGAFTWTPTEAQGPGEYTFDVCVSDGALSDCETITVTVNEVNVAPVLSPIGNFDIEELVPFTFTASATDADLPAQTLTYSLEDGTTGHIPAGASINLGTGVFTWTPTEAQGPGVYTFDVCVSDGALQDCETITITVYEDLQVTDLDLHNAITPTGPWAAVPGSYASGFVMQLDPAVEYYYLDTNNITSNRPLADGLYPFLISSHPADFFDYWAARGVVSGATGWQGQMWQIINGNAPFFYLKVEGTNYTLLDGLQYAMGNTSAVLRINGSYLLGDYRFSGVVKDAFGFSETVDVDIRFIGLLELTDAQLQYSLDQIAWTDLSGSFGAGYSMLLDTAQDFYYLNAPSVTVNRPLAVGLHPFFVKSYPADFFAYWAGKGVVSGATGWQGVMWNIINGNAPIFYLKVSAGPVYQLVDGLNYQYAGAVTYLRINGSYLPGEYSYSGTVTDIYGYTDDAEVDILFNDIPVAQGQSVSTAEDTAVSINLGAVDLYPGTLTWEIVSSPAHGILSGTAPSLTYTPAADYHGTDSFTFRVNDGTSNSNVATVSITITAVNDAPIFDPIGDKSVDEGVELSFTATAADVDGDVLAFSLVGAPAGAAIDPATGAFTWTPTEAQGPGEYTFTVKVCDNGTPVLCDEEEIKVTVNEVNLAPVAVDDAYSTLKNQVLNVGAPGVLGNDSDADIPASTLTAVLVTDIPSGEGTLVLAASGAFSYTPPVGFIGQTTFYYKVFDGALYSGTAKVTITVTDSNLAPTDILLTDQTILENLPVGSVVAYLSALDPNVGDTFTFSLVSGTGDTDNASFSISGNILLSAVVFDYETKDSYSIRIRVTDQGGLWYEKSFIISILDVNDAPIANDQTVSTPEDTPLTITLTGSDQDGDPLTYAVIAHPTHGVLTGTAPNLTYAPAADYHGTDSFTFQASDYALVSNIATITINVTAVNDAPVLGAIGNKSVPELTLLTFTAAATDLDGDTLTFSLVGAPVGAAIDPATGAFTWTPTEAQGPGEYTFTVKVCDNGTPVLCDEEEITVTVNEVNVAPVLGAIGDKTVDELTLLSFTATATDADLPANTLTFSLVGATAGAAIDPATGVFTWTPTEAQGPGEYTFTVKVCDNGTPALCDEEEIKVIVNEVNVAPVLGAIGDKTVDELILLSFTATATDADIPANTLTFSLVGAPAGAAIDPATGAFTWTPTEAQGPGEYTFTVKVCDNGTPVLCDEEEIKVTVFEVNTAPTARDQSVTTPEDTPIDIFLDVSDPENDPLTTIIITGPSHGQVSVNGIVVTYTPDLNYNGTDSFTYKVNDGLEDSYIATVSITVTPVNDPPVAYGMTVETLENFPVDFELLATDPEGDIGTFIIVTTPAHGTLDCDGRYCTYTPDPNWNGEDGFYFKVNDGELDSNEAFVKIIVHQGPRIYIPILFK